MEKKPRLKSSNIWEKRIIYFFVLGSVTILMFVPLFFKSELESYKSFGLFGIFIINLLGSATIFLPTPAILSIGVGAKIYNPLLVALLGAAGSSIGDSLGLVFGHASKRVLNINTHPLLSYLGQYFLKKYGTIAMFVLALIPNPIFDGIGIIAGIVGYSPIRFLFVTFLGRFLRNILITYAILSL